MRRYNRAVSILAHAAVQRPKVDFYEETPHITLASRVYYCQFGRDQKLKRKEKSAKV